MRSAALVVAFLSGVQAQAFPYGPPLPVEFGATHVADNSDVVKWTCPNLTFADIDILDFDPVTKNIPEIRLHLRNCKFVKNGPGGLIGLVVSIVQGLVLITLGPAIAIYGPTFRRFTSLVQAVVISSYILLINSIISVDALSAFFVFERTITLIISVLTVTYMSSKSPGGRAKAAGFALGQLIGTPLFGFIAQQLYEPVCGCSGLGKKSTYFPNGEPLGCDLFATDFQLIYQLSLLARWIMVFVFTYYGETFINFSTATTGATMLVKGIIDVVKAVGFEVAPDDAQTIVKFITPIRTWVAYGLAFAAYGVQRLLIEPDSNAEDDEGNKIENQFKIKDAQPKVMSIFCGGLIKCINRAEAWLKKNLESIGNKKQIMNTLSKKVKSATSKSATSSV